MVTLLLRLLFFVCLLSIFAGCGRWVPGYIVTEDGEVLSNTDENMRSSTINTMRSQLDTQLGEYWRTDITIAELPIHQADDRTLSNGWMWPKATISITVIGNGKGDPLLTNEEITKAVYDYMYHKVERPTKNLLVTTTSVVDVDRFKPSIVNVSHLTTNSNSEQKYTVQSDDTYADLSLAFYGSTAHWRIIANANKSIELKPGVEIIIPPKPK